MYLLPNLKRLFRLFKNLTLAGASEQKGEERRNRAGGGRVKIIKKSQKWQEREKNGEEERIEESKGKERHRNRKLA